MNVKHKIRKIKKKIKQKHTYIKIIPFLVVFMFFFSIFLIPQQVAAAENDYTYYMKSRALDVKSDQGNLLINNATSGNSWRNEMAHNERVTHASNFSINQPPSKTGYAVNQFYFDNLSNDRAWESDVSGEVTNSTASAFYGTENYAINNGTIIDEDAVGSAGDVMNKYILMHNFEDGYGPWADQANNELETIGDNHYLRSDGSDGTYYTYYDQDSDFDNVSLYDQATLQASVPYDYTTDCIIQIYHSSSWNTIYNNDEGSWNTGVIDISDYISDDFDIRVGLGIDTPFMFQYHRYLEWLKMTFWDVEPSEADYTETIWNTTGAVLSSNYGDYPATYSFEGETGETDTDIEFVDYISSGNPIIVDSWQGHSDVMETTDAASRIYDFPNVDSGIVEYYMGVEENDERSSFAITNSAPSPAEDIRIFFENDGHIKTYNGASLTTILSNYNTDYMYHIKVEFECSTSTFSVWIDGDLVADSFSFRGTSQGNINRIGLYYQTSGQTSYIDAIGYSWDSDYQIGDNYYYQHYLGSETFENYNITDNAETALEDNGWTVSLDADTSVGIAGEFGLHQKYLNLTDNGGEINARNHFSNKINPTVEFYIKTSDTSLTTPIYLHEGGVGIIIYIGFRSGELQYYDGIWHTITTVNNDEWYHLKLELDDTNNEFDCWVNSTKFTTNGGCLTNSVNGIDNIQFRTSFGGTGYSVYIDSIGYSWDSDYGIGDNLHCNRETYKDDFDTQDDEYWDFSGTHWEIAGSQFRTTDYEDEVNTYATAETTIDLTNCSEAEIEVSTGGNSGEYTARIYVWVDGGSAELFREGTWSHTVDTIDLAEYIGDEVTVKLRIHRNSWWERTGMFSGVWHHYNSYFDYFQINKTYYPMINKTYDFEIDSIDNIDDYVINYNFNTTKYTPVNLTIWNNDLEQWDLINNTIGYFHTNTYNLNSSYVDSNNNISLNFYGINGTTDFQIEIDQLGVYHTDISYYEYYNYLNFDFELEIKKMILIYEFFSNFSVQFCDLASNITLDTDYDQYWNIYVKSDLGNWTLLNITDFSDTDTDLQDEIPLDYLNGSMLYFRLEMGYWKPFTIEIAEFTLHYRYMSEDNIGYHSIKTTYTNGASEEMTMNIYRDFLLIEFEELMLREYTFDLNTIGAESLEITNHFRVSSAGEAVLQIVITYNQDPDQQETLFFRDDDFGLGEIVYENFTYSYNNPREEFYEGKLQDTRFPILAGFRNLYTEETEFNRFIEIPLYSQKVDVTIEEPDRTEQAEVDDPEPPSGGKYWDMWTWEIQTIETTTISHGDFVFDYDKIGPTAVKIEFGYDDETISYIDNSDWGDWGVNNWMRNLMVAVVNAIILVINQIILWVLYGSLYIITLALNWFFVGLIVGVIFCSIWNNPMFWLINSSVALFWVIWDGLVEFFTWLWEDVFIPMYEWLLDEFLPWWISVWITIIVFIPVVIITLLMGEPVGGEYYLEMMSMGTDFVYEAGELMLSMVILFADNWWIFVGALLFYLLGVLMLFSKYWVFNMKGDVKKAESAWMSAVSFIRPFIIIADLIKRMKDSTPQVAGTG